MQPHVLGQASSESTELSTATETTRRNASRSDENKDDAIDLRDTAEGTLGVTLSRTVSARERRLSRVSSRRASRIDYDAPDTCTNLDELIDVSPIQNPDEEQTYHHETLERTRSRYHEHVRHERPHSRDTLPRQQEKTVEREAQVKLRVSKLATRLYTMSYLVFFSILGTLARLALQALTTYPGNPVIFASLWPNFGGSLIMGFLAEDRMLFRTGWGQQPGRIQPAPARRTTRQTSEETTTMAGTPLSSNVDNHQPQSSANLDSAAAKKAHGALKKTIPLYIGMATGFCGSFTSFSAFARDMFLALSNDLIQGSAGNPPRNGGYSFMALLAVLLTTISLSLSGLFLGAQLAIALERVTPSLPYLFTHRVLDRLVVPLGWGCWFAIIFLCVWPPDRDSGGTYGSSWRGGATFALAFAPLGCLLRFYGSLRLNSRIASFPLGTFAVNMLGTAVLGAAWDLAHAPFVSDTGANADNGTIIGCQVLQGIEDGFCGCLTTVSTWVAELAALRRRHAYLYGGASVVLGLALLVVIMGSMQWSVGFSDLVCVHSIV